MKFIEKFDITNHSDRKIMPQKLKLANVPTPLEYLRDLSETMNLSLWVKRDDLTGCAESGNKIRKLEYLVADAMSSGANTLITCGGEQSNHCRATAIVARKLGMNVHLVLRRTGEGPTGNFLLDTVLGATIRWVSPEEYKERDKIMDEEAKKINSSDGKAYVIPEGGSNYLGMLGYVDCSKEFIDQWKETGLDLPTIVVASGSGGTYAGLWVGFSMLGVDIRLVGISAGQDVDEQKEHIFEIAKQCNNIFNFGLSLDPRKIELLDGYWHPGYGLITPEIAEFVMWFAKKTGLILGPTYTGKAFNAAFKLIKSGEIDTPKPIVLWHTGGIFDIFPKGQFFRELYFSGDRLAK